MWAWVVPCGYKTVKRLLNSALWNPLRHCPPVAFSSVIVHSCKVHPCKFFRHCPLLQCPPLQIPPSMSTPAISVNPFLWPKCSKTRLLISLIPKIFQGLYTRTPVEKGRKGVASWLIGVKVPACGPCYTASIKTYIVPMTDKLYQFPKHLSYNLVPNFSDTNLEHVLFRFQF